MPDERPIGGEGAGSPATPAATDRPATDPKSGDPQGAGTTDWEGLAKSYKSDLEKAKQIERERDELKARLQNSPLPTTVDPRVQRQSLLQAAAAAGDPAAQEAMELRQELARTQYHLKNQLDLNAITDAEERRKVEEYCRSGEYATVQAARKAVRGDMADEAASKAQREREAIERRQREEAAAKAAAAAAPGVSAPQAPSVKTIADGEPVTISKYKELLRAAKTSGDQAEIKKVQEMITRLVPG